MSDSMQLPGNIFFAPCEDFSLPLTWCTIVRYPGTDKEASTIECAWAIGKREAIEKIAKRYGRASGYVTESDQAKYLEFFVKNTRIELMGITEGLVYHAIRNLFMDSESGSSLENSAKLAMVMKIFNEQLLA